MGIFFFFLSGGTKDRRRRYDAGPGWIRWRGGGWCGLGGPERGGVEVVLREERSEVAVKEEACVGSCGARTIYLELFTITVNVKAVCDAYSYVFFIRFSYSYTVFSVLMHNNLQQ